MIQIELHDKPLVSVGIPAYNRPEGLKSALESIINQTYQNLEIIVSNNNSPNKCVHQIALAYAKKDNRIKYFVQKQNVGAAANFKFVLNQARGKYFAWLADDDIRELDFIDRMLDLSFLCSNFSTACCNSRVVYYGNNGNSDQKSKISRSPFLLPTIPRFDNLNNFITNLYPQIIYGLHDRVSIQWLLGKEWFDWFDCYFAIHQLTRGYQIITDQAYFGMTSGIYGKEYKPNPYIPDTTRTFLYVPFLSNSCHVILGDAKLSVKEKFNLLYQLVRFSLNSFLQWESQKQPTKAKLAEKALYGLITIRRVLK